MERRGFTREFKLEAVKLIKERGAGLMIPVGPVHGGVERACVADQRHERGLYGISPARLAVSACISFESPAAMNLSFLAGSCRPSVRHASSAFSIPVRSGIR